MKNTSIKTVLSLAVQFCLFATSTLVCVSRVQADEPRAILLVIAEGLSSETKAALKHEVTELLRNGTALDQLVVVSGPNHKPIARLLLPQGDLRQRLRDRDVMKAVASIGNLLDSQNESNLATAGQVGMPQLAGTYWSLLSGKKNVRVVLAGTPEYHDSRFPFWSFRGFSYPSDRALTDPRSSCPFINRAHRKIPIDVEVVFLCPTEWGSDTRHRKKVLRWTQLALAESIGGELKRVTATANAAFQSAKNSGFEPLVFDEHPLVGMWTLTSGSHVEQRPVTPTNVDRQEQGGGNANETTLDESTNRLEIAPAQLPDTIDVAAPVSDTGSVKKPATDFSDADVSSLESDVADDLESTTESGASVPPAVAEIERVAEGKQPVRDEPPVNHRMADVSVPPQAFVPDTATAISAAYEKFPESIRNRIESEIAKRPQAVVVVLSWSSQCPHADLNLDFSRFRSVVQNSPRGSHAGDLETIEWAILDDLSPIETGNAWVDLFETHREVTASVRVTSMDTGLSRTTEINFGRSPDHGKERNRRVHSASWKQLDMKRMLVNVN